jgi:hypothetical protein
MVHKRLNPAFPRHDQIYRIAFDRLDVHVKGYAGSKFVSAAWTDDFARALKARPQLSYEDYNATFFDDEKCEACNRSGHVPTFKVTFGGKAYHPETLESLNDDDADSDDDDDDDDKSYDYDGRVLPGTD